MIVSNVHDLVTICDCFLLRLDMLMVSTMITNTMPIFHARKRWDSVMVPLFERSMQYVSDMPLSCHLCRESSTQSFH